MDKERKGKRDEEEEEEEETKNAIHSQNQNCVRRSQCLLKNVSQEDRTNKLTDVRYPN